MSNKTIIATAAEHGWQWQQHDMGRLTLYKDDLIVLIRPGRVPRVLRGDALHALVMRRDLPDYLKEN